MHAKIINAYKNVLNAHPSYEESDCPLAKRRFNDAKKILSKTVRECHPNLDEKGHIKLCNDLQKITK